MIEVRSVKLHRGNSRRPSSRMLVMMQSTFYKKVLPCPPATPFSSQEGRQLFQEALTDGTMTGFFKLMEQFSTQDEPAFCGLASLSMVLNALAIDPRRPWRGVWRWFNEELLDCCSPLDEVKLKGVTLSQAACLARCNGAKVDMARHGIFTESEFRQQVLDVCSSGEEHLVVSYSRRSFKQTGDGHFSPVGGYHRGRDLVLILDVARFKYPPHWVPLSLLYEAMSHLDPVTGLPRGYLHLSSHPLLQSVMFTLNLRQEGWQQGRDYVNGLPMLLDAFLLSTTSDDSLAASGGPQSQQGGGNEPLSAAAAVVRHLVGNLPPDGRVASFLAVRGQSTEAEERCTSHQQTWESLLAELRSLPLYQLVLKALNNPNSSSSSGNSTAGIEGADFLGDFLAERISILILLQPPTAWLSQHWTSAEASAQWQMLLGLSGHTIAEAEVAYLRQQFLLIDELSPTRRPSETSCGPACSATLGCTDTGL